MGQDSMKVLLSWLEDLDEGEGNEDKDAELGWLDKHV
jgi:hypothetical protein